jgi:peroxiredoxin
MARLVQFLLFLLPFLLSAQTNELDTGYKVPDFHYTDLAGNESHIKDLRGKHVLIVFFATWCGPCLKELPHIHEKIWNRFGSNQNFELMIVGREHTKEELKAFADKFAYPMPFYADPKREIFSKFAPNTIPRTYLINPTGEIVYMSIGFSIKPFMALVDKLEKTLSE